MNNETTDGGATVPCISLLADVIAFRDECRTAQRDLIPPADPTGDARLAYGVCADQLTALIERHQGKANATAHVRAVASNVEQIVGHVCFYCHHVFDQTKDNPARTDVCVKCGHRGEGVKRTLEKCGWGILHVVPNDKAQLRSEAE